MREELLRGFRGLHHVCTRFEEQTCIKTKDALKQSDAQLRIGAVSDWEKVSTCSRHYLL